MNTPHLRYSALMRLLLPVLTLVLATTALASPSLTITPERVQPGETVLVTYSGFMPGGYNATLNLDGVPLQDIYIPAGGSGSFSWPLPADLILGGHDIDICAFCFQFEFEERTNTVRLTVETGELTGSQFNLQPWAIEVTQGVRGDIPMRTLPDGGPVFPEEDVVHVANRRTVVRVYPFVEGGPGFNAVYGVKAVLWASVNGVNYGPLEPEDPSGVNAYAAATMEDLRSDLRRSWNFVLPREVTELDLIENSGTFSLTVRTNPLGPDRKPECSTCYDDNIANLYNNQFQHVGRGQEQTLTYRPHLVEAEVAMPDGSTLFQARPTQAQLIDTIRSLHLALPVADGVRGIRVRSHRNVDWAGPQADEGEPRDLLFISNYLPSGELRAAPANDYYSFLFFNPPGCAGHAYLNSPLLFSGVCDASNLVTTHELTHAIGSAHAGNGHGEDDGGGYDANYPGDHGGVESNTWGLDVNNLRVYPPTLGFEGDDLTHCFMSYGNNRWVSRYTWELVAANLGTPEINVDKAQELPSILVASKRADILGFVSFRGLLDTGGAVDLEPFLASYEATQDPGDGTYELEFYDTGNDLLFSQRPQLVKSQDVEQPWSMFAEAVALPVGWAEMRLLEGGVVTQTWQRSANPPTVAITSPANGFQWANSGDVTLTWDATDLDDDDLVYRVFALQTNANELLTLANGLVSPSLTLDRATLPSGGDWAFIVEASDGLDRTYSAFTTGYVQPTAPEVMIIQPPDDSVQVAGATVRAMGIAADLQGEISPGNMNWFLDGSYVGSGETFDVPDVTTGSHVLTFTVYNALQIEGSASVNLQVVDALAVPELTAPADGADVGFPANLTWTTVPGAISYRVQVSADPNFSEILAEVGNLGDPAVPFQGDPALGTFYWRVMGEHGTAPSGWSLARSFTPNAASAVDDLPGARELALTVYPNPFNPATTVSFDLPRGGYVNLAVYDLAGRLVRRLAAGDFATGRHEVAWNGRDSQGLNAGSGVYLMRLVTPSGTTSMRATLLK